MSATNGESFTHRGRLDRSLASCPDDLSYEARVAPKLHPPFLHVGAGDVQLIGRQPFGVLKDPDDLDVVLDAVAEYIGYNGCIVFS